MYVIATKPQSNLIAIIIIVLAKYKNKNQIDETYQRAKEPISILDDFLSSLVSSLSICNLSIYLSLSTP
jgi:hypothetical protein